MTRITAGDRMRRMLAIVPFVMAHPDGVTLGELSRRFEIPRARLESDLDTMWMVGTYPYTPDCLIEAWVEDDRVRFELADSFARPLRLTPDEAVALIVTARGVLASPGVEASGPLARGVRKLAAVLDVDVDSIDIDLGAAEDSVVDLLTTAASGHRIVEIDYYTYGRDEHSTRRIAPGRIFSDQGQWYVAAHCETSGGDRVFRLDRIERAALTPDAFDPAIAPVGLGLFDDGGAGDEVTLDLVPEVRWVAEEHPLLAAEELDGGGLRVRLAIDAPAWFARLVLWLGDDVEIAAAPADLIGKTLDAAERVLARYRS